MISQLKLTLHLIDFAFSSVTSDRSCHASFPRTAIVVRNRYPENVILGTDVQFSYNWWVHDHWRQAPPSPTFHGLTWNLEKEVEKLEGPAGLAWTAGATETTDRCRVGFCAPASRATNITLSQLPPELLITFVLAFWFACRSFGLGWTLSA